ncbi:hypothetical protein Pres01_29660 [Metapseudomonas resinovorans]|uniref:hypothetical protein n=1 Tax=Metapseudomonas resinovorans TaxID=53412 RepID=UPI001F2E5C18|nr:hypothetical protein [Pseudomonas resinovorans]GLZ86915.1 hypothetical protein Pres01_29660 [Pseudomonas resinovorans]
MRTISLALLSLAATLTLTGCSIRIADLTVASTKNFNMNSNALETGRRVEGKDQVAVVLFPLGQPNMKEAIDRAVEKERCAVGLSNVVINQEAFAFLVGYVAVSVEGNLILDRALPGCGGYASQGYQPAPASEQTSPYRSKEAQLQQLEQQQSTLSYEEYQRRYREIVGQ